MGEKITEKAGDNKKREVSEVKARVAQVMCSDEDFFRYESCIMHIR